MIWNHGEHRAHKGIKGLRVQVAGASKLDAVRISLRGLKEERYAQTPAGFIFCSVFPVLPVVNLRTHRGAGICDCQEALNHLIKKDLQRAA